MCFAVLCLRLFCVCLFVGVVKFLYLFFVRIGAAVRVNCSVFPMIWVSNQLLIIVGCEEGK